MSPNQRKLKNNRYLILVEPFQDCRLVLEDTLVRVRLVCPDRRDCGPRRVVLFEQNGMNYYRVVSVLLQCRP